jgi:hypothetical protein
MEFWVAPQNRYTLELWDTSATKRRQIQRAAPWFEPWFGSIDPTKTRPKPQVKGIAEDAAGRLWVNLLIADASWVPVPPRAPSTAIDPNKLFDSRIELIDPRSGQLLAFLVVPEVLVNVRGGEPIVSSFRTNADGFVIWTLYRLTVRGLE